MKTILINNQSKNGIENNSKIILDFLNNSNSFSDIIITKYSKQNLGGGLSFFAEIALNLASGVVSGLIATKLYELAKNKKINIKIYDENEDLIIDNILNDKQEDE